MITQSFTFFKKAPIEVKLIFIFVLLFPFYPFTSGYPQPADWCLALSVIIFFFKDGLSLKSKLKIDFNALRNFAIYACLVTIIWYPLIDQSFNKRFPTIFFALFFIYNSLAYLIFTKAFERYGLNFLSTFALFSVYSVIIQFISSFFLPGTYRVELFFNNPNQLGYYILLIGSVFYIYNHFAKVKISIQVIFGIAFLYLSAVSNSRAAMAGAGLLIVLSLISSGFLKFRQLLFSIFFIGLIYLFSFNTEFGQDLYENIVDRFETDRGVPIEEERGYDRIPKYPEYLVFGAGEGGFYRFFDSGEMVIEIHSTYGTILFSYGIIGSVLFLIFLFRVLTGLNLFSLLYLIPVFSYGITHNGLRFTLFWILLSFSSCLSYEVNLRRNRKKNLHSIAGIRNKKNIQAISSNS